MKKSQFFKILKIGLKAGLQLFLLIIITACASTQKITGYSSNDAIDLGFKTQLISHNQEKIVCYSEIKSQDKMGVACQTSAGIALFNANIEQGQYQIKQPSKYLSPIKPDTILDLLYFLRIYPYIDKNQANLTTNTLFSLQNLADNSIEIINQKSKQRFIIKNLAK